VYTLKIPLPATLSARNTPSISFNISVFMSNLPSVMLR
jgi:hypothetical protein